MKSKSEQLFDAAKAVRLSEKEKARARDLVLRYMRMNPVREGNDMRHKIQRASLAGQRSPIAKISIIQFLFKPMVIPIIVLVAIFAGGGVSVAANDTIPGDVLYPVKVGVNENVRSAFAFSQEAKAEWKVEQVGRRLQEAEKLAVEGKLNEKAAATLEAKFNEHTESMTTIASNLQAGGRAEVAAGIHSNLEATLEAHAKILTALKSETGNAEAAQLLGIVEVQAQTSRVARAGSETELQGQTSAQTKQAAEGKLNAVRNKIAEVKSFLTKTKSQAGTSVTVAAEEVLKAAEGIVVEGQARVQVEEYREAFVLFQYAIRLVQEAKAIVQAGVELNIDLDDVNLAPPIPGDDCGAIIEFVETNLRIDKPPADIMEKYRRCKGLSDGTEVVACTLEYAPVCGVDGKTYQNRCFARASRVMVAHEGECRDTIVRPEPCPLFEVNMERFRAECALKGGKVLEQRTDQCGLVGVECQSSRGTEGVPDINLDDVNLAPPIPDDPFLPPEPPGSGTETNIP